MAFYDTTYQTRLHAPFEKTRERTIGALYGAFINSDPEERTPEMAYAEKTVAKLANCGRYAAMYQDAETGELIQSQARCKNRMCPKCNAIRSARLKQAMTGHLDKLNSPRMMTLTLEHSDRPLKVQIKDLFDSYRRLRRSKQYQYKIKGGVAVLEITYNREKRQWHPHIHVLVDGEYWSKFELSDAWKRASNGSKIVHIKAIHDRSKASHYVAKYVAKIGDVDGIPAIKLPEMAEALHGVRMVQTSGSLYGVTNNPKREKRSQPLVFIAPLGRLAEAGINGDVRAKRILKALQLATRFQRSAGPDGLTESDQFRSRKAAKCLWDWWNQQTEDHNHGTTKRLENKARKHKSSDRTERLWQEPERTADALTHGL